MRSFIFKALLIATSLSGVGVSAQAPSDRRAVEGVALFKSFCVQRNGARDGAVAVLGAGNALANRLPSATTDKLLGQTDTVGWAIRSPSGAQLMLGYGKSGHCEVRLVEADEGAVVAQFEQLTGSLPNNDVTALKPETRNEDGARRTFLGFRFGKSPALVTLALTTSDKRVGDQQHFLTFDLS
jgi:hypothetical protein